jgi:arsenite methyltransferase
MKPNYGIDAPGVVRNFAMIATVGWAVALLGPPIFSSQPLLAKTLQSSGFCAGIWFLASALTMIWGSKAGKFRLRDRLLNTIAWRGDEEVLDVGCGRGLMVVGAAKRLTSGRAFGIDLWHTEDQSGSSAINARQNAEIEGVADRVEIRDGDATEIPFPSGFFDVVLSSFCIHNIDEEERRRKAVAEIARVLRPGGRLILIDIRHTGEYAEVLNECGLAEVKIGGPNFMFVIPTNWVTARKP